MVIIFKILILIWLGPGTLLLFIPLITLLEPFASVPFPALPQIHDPRNNFIFCNINITRVFTFSTLLSVTSLVFNHHTTLQFSVFWRFQLSFNFSSSYPILIFCLLIKFTSVSFQMQLFYGYLSRIVVHYHVSLSIFCQDLF